MAAIGPRRHSSFHWATLSAAAMGVAAAVGVGVWPPPLAPPRRARRASFPAWAWAEAPARPRTRRIASPSRRRQCRPTSSSSPLGRRASSARIHRSQRGGLTLRASYAPLAVPMTASKSTTRVRWRRRLPHRQPLPPPWQRRVHSPPSARHSTLPGAAGPRAGQGLASLLPARAAVQSVLALPAAVPAARCHSCRRMARSTATHIQR